MKPAEIVNLIDQLAREAGFESVGITPAQPITHADYFDEWLKRGYAGEMDYLGRHRDLRVDPRGLLGGARSIIVVAHNYHQSPEIPAESCRDYHARGRVSEYAWGRDYHRVIRKKLKRVANRLSHVLEIPFEWRICVDTAPIMEREFAALAGIGWIGKNTTIINRKLGSFFFLGEIITTLDLPASLPETDHCGTCTRCLEACPTGALTAPRQMDASRCISYLTIEHRSEIPEELQPLMSNWIYGCDICQEVCPYNQQAPMTHEPDYQLNTSNPLLPYPQLNDLIHMTDDQYKQYTTASAIKRASLNMLQRNAKIALRNNRNQNNTK